MADTLTHYITAVKYLKRNQHSDDWIRGFYFGVQGPDVFFFGEGGMAFGNSIHDKVPGYLFEKDIESLPEKSELYQGYAYGVMLHYFEDRIMHQYVNYLCRQEQSPSAHSKREKEFDMVMCKRQFGYPIRKFNFASVYAVDDVLTQTIYEYWSDRIDSFMLTSSYVDKAVRKMVEQSALLMKGNPFVALAVCVLDLVKRAKGTLIAHVKWGYSEAYMNDDHKTWEGVDGKKYNLSVEEIVEKGVTDFEAEMEKIKACLQMHNPYVFVHKENFVCTK